MEIKSTMRVAKVKPSALKEVKHFAGEGHDVAWQDQLNIFPKSKASSARIGLAGISASPLEELLGLDNLKSPKEARAAYLNLAMNTTSLVGKHFPEVLDEPIQGVEFVVSTIQAFDAWQDPEQSNHFTASVATGKAILNGIDFMANYVPALNNIGTYTSIAGMVLTTAESAYLVYSENVTTR